MTRLLGVLVGLITAILCWLAFPSSAGALVPAHPHATYTYDAPVYDAAGNDSVQERGPPGLAVARTTYDAVGLRSHGASARPDGPARGVTTIYTHLAPLVQVAQTSTTTGDRVVVAHGDLSSFQRSVSAANAGTRLGWGTGDDIYALTKAGNKPAWSTVRGRFWKNEAANPQINNWSAANLDRMSRGLAPQRYNRAKGGLESMELSHEPIPYCDGGTSPLPRWPQDHAAVDWPHARDSS